MTEPTALALLDDKISVACAAIKTALDALKTEGYFKVVLEDIIDPFKIQQKPALGILPARWSRDTHVWTCDISLMLACNAVGAKPADQVGRILTGLIGEKLDVLAAAGTAGCAMGKPLWEPWPHRETTQSPLVLVGSLGSLTITLNDPLLVRPST